MLKYKNFKFGVFFSKTCDGVVYTREIGVRLAWKPKHFIDVYFYPRPHIYKVSW